MAQDAGLPHANEGMAVGAREDGAHLRDQVLLPEGLQAHPAGRRRDSQPRSVQYREGAAGTNNAHLRRQEQGNRMQLAIGGERERGFEEECGSPGRQAFPSAGTLRRRLRRAPRAPVGRRHVLGEATLPAGLGRDAHESAEHEPPPRATRVHRGPASELEARVGDRGGPAAPGTPPRNWGGCLSTRRSSARPSPSAGREAASAAPPASPWTPARGERRSGSRDPAGTGSGSQGCGRARSAS